MQTSKVLVDSPNVRELLEQMKVTQNFWQPTKVYNLARIVFCVLNLYYLLRLLLEGLTQKYLFHKTPSQNLVV